MKQTAVEWLKFRYKNNINLMDYDFEQAKEIEKQNIIDAYTIGGCENDLLPNEEAEQYYNETFNK